jgi:hypothetical protein
MVVLGIDAHKRSHTVVAADDRGKPLATKPGSTGEAAISAGGVRARSR